MYLFWFSLTFPLKEDNEEKGGQAASVVPKVQKVTFQRRKGHQCPIGTWLCFL